LEHQQDILYNDSDQPLYLDFYPADAVGEGAAPLVVWIHGGAWQAGSRNNPPAEALISSGFSVASISYRFTDVAVFPAQLYDCKCAIRFLRARAAHFDIDPGRIGVWGASAGGHLAAMLALTTANSELEGAEGYASFSSAVQAACDWFGPADLVSMPHQASTIDHAGADSPEGRLVGGDINERLNLAKLASPISHVSSDSAPMLIVHGSEDPLVPYEQSTSLRDAMQAAGADVEFVTYNGSGHGDGEFRQSAATEEVLSFFKRRL
jgi:acetyl esterase/lipase